MLGRVEDQSREDQSQSLKEGRRKPIPRPPNLDDQLTPLQIRLLAVACARPIWRERRSRAALILRCSRVLKVLKSLSLSPKPMSRSYPRSPDGGRNGST